MSHTTHLVVDLGAGSGRVMAGHFDGQTLRIEEVHRFPNEGVQLPTGWHWNVTQLFADICHGLRRAAQQHGSSLTSVSVDTWGVDYGLLDRHGRLLGLPWMYRDSRTDRMMDATMALVPREEIYRRTGIQFLPFNTIYQLFAEVRNTPDVFAAADRLAFMPDLLTYWLSGERVIERTNASTSQLLKAGSPQWDLDLATKLGIPTRILHPTVEPGITIGSLLPSLMDTTGCGKLSVTTCGSHDTASAVAGVPAETSQPLFLSSGTWSLLGRELNAHLVNDETLAEGFSNEQGLCNTTRFLKNVVGMWLLQECMRYWKAQGFTPDYGTLVDQAREAQTTLLLNPDAPEFAKPCDMPAAIAAYAQKTGQPVPQTPGEFTRAILESLALRYRQLVNRLRRWMPDLPDTLHIVGGGSQNSLLNQMTADATGLRLMAGPVEATAAGNILAQLMATGAIRSLEEGRAVIRRSFEPRIFEPRNTALWEEKATRFERLTAS